METPVSGLLCRVRAGDSSRGQFPNRLEYGLGKLIQPSPIQSSAEGLTNASARFPKFYVILFVGHGVLNKRESKFLCDASGGDVLSSMRGGHL